MEQRGADRSSPLELPTPTNRDKQGNSPLRPPILALLDRVIPPLSPLSNRPKQPVRPRRPHPGYDLWTAGLNIPPGLAVFDIPASRPPRLSGSHASRQGAPNAHTPDRAPGHFPSTVHSPPFAHEKARPDRSGRAFVDALGKV